MFIKINEAECLLTDFIIEIDHNLDDKNIENLFDIGDDEWDIIMDKVEKKIVDLIGSLDQGTLTIQSTEISDMDIRDCF
jgi:hypothetical protein